MLGRDQIANRLLQRYQLRVEPHMLEYLSRRLQSPGSGVPVIGGESRTGVPIRLMIDPTQLSSDGESSPGADVAP